MNVARRLEELLQSRYVTRGRSLRSFAVQESPWSYAALQGRLVSLLPGPMNASLSALFQIVWDAQKKGETVAWVGGAQSCFYPPDVAKLGVDINALAVIRLASDKDIWFAVDTLIRSGGVGMVVIDMDSLSKVNSSHGVSALQHRLSGLARVHNAAVVLLPSSKANDNGPLVSLTVQTRKTPAHDFVGTYNVAVTLKKDKSGSSDWRVEGLYDAPDGVC